MSQAPNTQTDVEKGDAIQTQGDTGILAVTLPFLPELTPVKQAVISPKNLRQHRVSYYRRMSKENPIWVTAQGRSLPYIQSFRRKKTPIWPTAGKRTLMESSLS